MHLPHAIMHAPCPLYSLWMRLRFSYNGMTKSWLNVVIDAAAVTHDVTQLIAFDKQHIDAMRHLRHVDTPLIEISTIISFLYHTCQKRTRETHCWRKPTFIICILSYRIDTALLRSADRHIHVLLS